MEAEKAKLEVEEQRRKVIQAAAETDKIKMRIEAERSKADAAAYQAKSLAEANSHLHTPAYLELTKYESIAANAKIYFGEKIPTAMIGDWAAGLPVPAAAAG